MQKKKNVIETKRIDSIPSDQFHPTFNKLYVYCAHKTLKKTYNINDTCQPEDLIPHNPCL